MKFDNFMLSMHQTCPAKYNERINNQWTSRHRSGALGAGAALHAGLAEWYKGNGPKAALEAIEKGFESEVPIDDWRNIEKVRRTFAEYITQYPGENWDVLGRADGAPIVEVPFLLETGMHLPCHECQMADQRLMDFRFEDTCLNCNGPREPIEYGGILDMAVDFNSQVYIVDHKSTSQMGPTYFNQFKPNNQMTGYIWGAGKLSGRRCAGAIINAIAWSKTAPTRFARSITTRNDYDIDRWLCDVYSEACNIQQHQLTGHWPYRTNSCLQYGMCEFHQIHVMSTETEQQSVRETHYVKDNWDFENRDA